jgi:hypothetical protein
MRERFVRWRRRLHSLAVQEVEDGPFGSTLTGREIREPGNVSWKWGLDYRDEFVVEVETTLVVMGRVCQDGSFGRRVSGERSAEVIVHSERRFIARGCRNAHPE